MDPLLNYAFWSLLVVSFFVVLTHRMIHEHWFWERYTILHREMVGEIEVLYARTRFGSVQKFIRQKHTAPWIHADTSLFLNPTRNQLLLEADMVYYVKEKYESASDSKEVNTQFMVVSANLEDLEEDV